MVEFKYDIKEFERMKDIVVNAGNSRGIVRKVEQDDDGRLFIRLPDFLLVINPKTKRFHIVEYAE